MLFRSLAAVEGRDEEARIERARDRGERAAGRDRNGRRGEREGPRDLPQRTELIARPFVSAARRAGISTRGAAPGARNLVA